MKTLAKALFISLASTITATAGLETPRNSFPITELNEAKSYAAEKEKPLIFINT